MLARSSHYQKVLQGSVASLFFRYLNFWRFFWNGVVGTAAPSNDRHSSRQLLIVAAGILCGDEVQQGGNV